MNELLQDKLCSILAKTHDGEDLAPEHLSLVERICNTAVLSEDDEKQVLDLYAQVESNKYQKPFLHGIEHITMDHEGNIYYKGKMVENYRPSYAHSEEGKRELLKLASDCKTLENQGAEVSFGNLCKMLWSKQLATEEEESEC